MTARQTLRVNLRTLMAASGDMSLAQLSERVSACSRDADEKRVGKSTIQRILSDEGENARLETIEAIARVFELEAWQLLVPGLKPNSPPVLRSIGKAEDDLYKRIDDAIAKLEEAKKEL